MPTRWGYLRVPRDQFGITRIGRIFWVPQRHAPLNPLGENIDLLPRAGGRRRGDKFRSRVRLEILVVTVQLNDFKNVANPGHGNETTPCWVQLVWCNMMRGEAHTKPAACSQTESDGRNCGSGHVLATDVVIMGPRLRESNIFQQRFCAPEKCCEGSRIDRHNRCGFRHTLALTATARRAAVRSRYQLAAAGPAWPMSRMRPRDQTSAYRCRC